MDNSLDSVLSEEPADTGEVIEQPQVEAQVAEVAEADEADTGEEAAPPVAEQKDDPLEKHRKGLEAAATAERHRRQQAEQRAAQLERELQALRQPQQTPQAQATGQEPQREQFTTDAEYVRALVRYERETQRAEEQRAAAEEAQRQRELHIRTRAEMAMAEAAAIPGFNPMEFARVPVSEPMMDAILDSDVPGKLVHYLQTQPDEARRIAELPTAARQIAALARIEDKLSAAPKAEPPPKVEPQLPETLTQARNAKGQFEPAYSGPTPLNAILATK